MHLLKRSILLFTVLLFCGIFLSAEESVSESEEGFSQSSSDSEYEVDLGQVYTYLEKPVAEQKIIITKEEIEKSHSENLTSLLQSQGMQILSYGAYGLESKPSIRGFTDETVRVVIDGVCVNNAQYGTFDFSSINLNQIEKIEIVKGGFTEGISDEGSVGGTIYITTKKQDVKKHFSSDTSAKTYFNPAWPVDTLSQKLTFSSPAGENSFFKTSAALTLAQNRFLYKSDSNQYVYQDNSQVWDTDLSAAFTHFYGAGSSVTVSDALYAGNKYCPGVEHNTNIGLQKDYDNRFTINLLNPAIGNAFRLENNFAYLTNIRFYDADSESSSHYVNTITYASSLTYYASDFFRESLGFTFDGVFLDSSNDGKHNQFTYTIKSTSKFFFNDILSLSIPLAVKFQGENFAFVPKIGLKSSFKFVDINLSLYRMVQFPNMDDLYWSGAGGQGNPNLKVEKGWGGDISFNSKLNFLPLSLCIFTNYYENKIQWAVSNNISSPQNIASAFYAGVDLDIEKSFFNDILYFRFSGEYLYNRLLNKNDPYTYGKRIMWTPDFVASLVIRLNLEKWQASLETSYMGKRYISNLNISYMKPYVLMNASASFKANEWLNPYVRIENLLFQDYEAVENYPMPLTSVTLGCSIKKDW